jgi:hypothetical protein
MNHTAQEHVDVCVYPQWGEEDQERLDGVQGAVELVVNREDPDDVACRFPCAAHDKDQGEAFAVVDGLSGVEERGQAEEDGE